MFRGLMYGTEYYSSYFLYVLPAIILAGMAQILIKSRYQKYSRLPSNTNYTGSEIARIILDKNGLYNVKVVRTRGQLTDHYDPRIKTIRLSEGVYNSNSIAALSIAAHEVGHAIQDGESYLPLKIRNTIAPIASIGANLVWTLIFIGFVISSFFIELAIALFLLVVFFQVITLPVEINASKRALYNLEDGFIDQSTSIGAKKVLQAAALTYVAATLASIGELLRILVITNNRRESK